MFSAIDYVVFFGMLASSVFIGIYFGCFSKQQKTTDEYLLGGKSIKTVPVALSLVASNISGITLLAVPSDIYLYGANYFFVSVPIAIACILICFLYIPVILKLEVPNGYEYLKLRFNKNIRMLASFIFVLQIVLLNPVIVYVPAIAFSQVTGVNVYLITPIVSFVCIFYTTIGGFKAVIWTDVLQFAAMIISTLAVLCLGVMSIGNFKTIWKRAQEGERLNFDFSLDPTARENFWSVTIGATILWLNNGCLHPGSIQKYLSIFDRKNAKWSCILMCFGIIGLINLSIITGFILFANYKGCDPLSSRKIEHIDQMLPYFVLDVASSVPGVPGIFIAGLFSAALSSLSSSFNTLGATIYGDFITPYIPSDLSQKSTNTVLKLIVVISGVICTALTFVVGKVGSILAFVNASQCCVAGLLVGLFSLGMLFPMANSKGALWGTVVSFIVTFWIATFHEWYKLKGAFNHFVKPLSVENCTFQFNFTSAVLVVDIDEPFVLYRLSYWYNSFIGASLLIVIGLIVSWFTKNENDCVNPKLISPIFRFLIEKTKMNNNDFAYYNVDKNVEMTTYSFNKEY